MNSTTDPAGPITEKTQEWPFPFSEKDWAGTSEPVKNFNLA